MASVESQVLRLAEQSHSDFFWSVGKLSPKQPPRPTLMTYSSVTSLSWLYQDIYTAKYMWLNASQTIYASGLGDWITLRHGGSLHLYLTLPTFDLIIQLGFKNLM